MKIIAIEPDDYLLLKELAERQRKPAARIIKELLNPHRKTGLTHIIIDVFYNYWEQSHGTKYVITPKDGAAAKRIGSMLEQNLNTDDPVFIGQIFEKILLTLKGTFYYGKELATLSGGFNSILVGYKKQNEPGIAGSW